MNTNVSYELCVTMICQRGFISCNKLTTFDGAADNEEEWRGVVSGSTPYFYSISSDPNSKALKFKHRINTANAKIIMSIQNAIDEMYMNIFT